MPCTLFTVALSEPTSESLVIDEIINAADLITAKVCCLSKHSC